MPLNKALIPSPLGVGGVDTRPDSKTIAPPKLSALENAVFTTPGALRKRHGYTQIASQEYPEYGGGGVPIAISGARAIAALDDELVVADKDSLLSYSNGYMIRRGPFSPFEVHYEDFTADTGVTAGALDCAVTSDLTVYAWQAGSGGCYITTVDTATGAVLLREIAVNDLLGSTGWISPACVTVGAYLYVFVYRSASTAISAIRIERTGGLVTLTNYANLVTDVMGAAPVWDVRAGSGQILLVYNSSTATTIKYGYISTSGVAGAMTTQTTAAAVTKLCVCVEPNTFRFLIAWAMNANSKVTCRMFDAAKNPDFAALDLETAETDYQKITAAFTGVAGAPYTCHVIYEQKTTAQPNRVKHASITSGGSGTTGVNLVRVSKILSHAFAHDGAVYVAIQNVATNVANQNAFLVRCGTVGNTGNERLADGMIMAGGILPMVDAGLLPHVALSATGRYRIPMTYVVQSVSGDWVRQAKIVDFATGQPVQMLQVGGCLYATGGLLAQYDGAHVSEVGFWIYPEVTATAVAGGSLTGDATYGLLVYYEWTKRNGERERSPAVALSVATTAANKTLQLTIKPLIHTLKAAEFGLDDVQIVVFRTLANGALYYRASGPPPTTGNDYSIPNDRTVNSISWSTTLPDTTIAANELAPVSQGVVDAIAPPPCRIMATGNDRVFLSGLSDPNKIIYSKLRETQEPVAFNEGLQLFVDEGDGPITGLAMLGDALVVFREHYTMVVTGDGADNAGNGSSWSPVQVISRDLGCVAHRSICRIPQGLVFQSRKGLYLFTGGELQFLGADAFGYVTPPSLAPEAEPLIDSAVVMPDRHEVRFGYADGSGVGTLLYDYEHNAFANWSCASIDACLWKGTYIRLATAAGSVQQEGYATFQDNGSEYALLIRTGWYHVAGLQDFERVWEILAIGKYYGNHKIQVKVFYDYIETAVDTKTWDPASVTGVTAGTAIYQIAIRPSKQRVRAIKLEFKDISDGSNPLVESFSLSELQFKIGVLPMGSVAVAPNRRVT